MNQLLFPTRSLASPPSDQPWTSTLDALRSKRIQKQLNEWELAFLERQAAQPRHLPLREWAAAQLRCMYRGIFEAKGEATAMSKSLNISDDLKLPVELAARTQCIFAQKGAGKTYAAGVMCEEMLGAGVQVCVLDPTGVWWGLQSSADGGQSPFEIIVMGGGHGDVPLEPDAGEIVANFLVETGQSVVLDVSQFESQAAQDRFALALATKLYRLKAHDKANIHIFLDEADQFCPMKPQKGQERLLHAWDMIVRLGRSRGLGLTAISNRPAVVHTNIRNNVDLLTCLRVTGPHDFKALREWTSINATAEQSREFLESVPKLPDGEAFFWSPGWLRTFQQAKVRTKGTFDSSRTPKPGERAIKPKERRAPDLTKLTEQIKASVQRAKANDPGELKKEIASLKKQIATPTAQAVISPKVIEKQVITDKQLDRLTAMQEKIFTRVEAWWKQAGDKINPLMDLLHGQRDELAKLIAAARAVQGTAPINHKPGQNPGQASVTTPARSGHTTKPVLPAVGDRTVAPAFVGDLQISKKQQQILDAVAWYESLGNSRPTLTQIGAVALIDPTGGHFSNVVGPLSSAGLIERDAGTIRLTTAGRAVAVVPQMERSLGDYHEVLRQRVRKMKSSGGKTIEILNAIIAAGGESLTIARIGEAVSIDTSGGHFSNMIGPLGTAGLIERRAGTVTPTAVLFPEGLA